MEDKILVKCGCGKRYRVPAERLGSTLECKHCGESFVACWFWAMVIRLGSSETRRRTGEGRPPGSDESRRAR